tara:strand:+ start:75 stop:644 length:570 start_codon:yes stop_codon:yes gene_type:complete
MRLILIIFIFLTNSCSIIPTKKASQDHACSLIESKRSWKRAVIKTKVKWGVSPGMQLSFILTESNFRPRAKTQRTYFLGFFPTGRLSSAFGYAQAIDSTWETYQKSTGNRFSSRTNFADSVDFIGWYANETTRRLKIKKADVMNQYLAYHQGHRGYSRGSYKNKPNLVEIAKKTSDNALKYDTQLKSCP